MTWNSTRQRAPTWPTPRAAPPTSTRFGSQTKSQQVGQFSILLSKTSRALRPWLRWSGFPSIRTRSAFPEWEWTHLPMKTLAAITKMASNCREICRRPLSPVIDPATAALTSSTTRPPEPSLRQRRRHLRRESRRWRAFRRPHPHRRAISNLRQKCEKSAEVFQSQKSRRAHRESQTDSGTSRAGRTSLLVLLGKI